MNDQRPCFRVGDRVTLHDPKHAYHGMRLTITHLEWDPNWGEWIATTTAHPDDATCLFITRRTRDLKKGW
jgi:hypothetical protein